MSFGLGDEFIITMSLDFAEEDIAVRHRAKRIQGRAGCWGWGDFFDTIDVYLDRVVAVVFFGVSRYFFGMGHISSPEGSVIGTLNTDAPAPAHLDSGQKLYFLGAVSGILVQMTPFRSIMN
jgi:hypothetical protein